MSILPDWSEELAIGDAQVDAQHRRLFELVHELATAIALDYGLDELLRYSFEHFADEEALMERIGYPDLAEHRQWHGELATEFDGFWEDYLAERIDRQALLGFLAKWLYHHVSARP